jgi:hypothetical protein
MLNAASLQISAVLFPIAGFGFTLSNILCELVHWFTDIFTAYVTVLGLLVVFVRVSFIDADVPLLADSVIPATAARLHVNDVPLTELIVV